MVFVHDTLALSQKKTGFSTSLTGLFNANLKRNTPLIKKTNTIVSSLHVPQTTQFCKSGVQHRFTLIKK